MTTTESETSPSYPSQQLTRVSTAVAIDAAAGAPPKRANPWQVFKEMPIPVKAATMWLLFIFFGAIYAKIDGWVGGGLPLKDPYFQGVDFRTGERSALPNESPSADHQLGTDGLALGSADRSPVRKATPWN